MLTGTILYYEVVITRASVQVYNSSIPPHTVNAIQQLENMYSNTSDAFDLSLSVDNLEQSKTYNVSVYAVSSVGAGQTTSTWIVIPVIQTSSSDAVVMGTAIGASLGFIVLVLITILVNLFSA